MNHIAQDILSIREPTRCTKTWRRIFGGREWNKRLWDTWLNVTPIGGLKLIIWDPLEIYNHWAFPSGNGKISTWISLSVYPAPCMGITPYRSSWIVWPSPLISYLWPPCTDSTNIHSYTSLTLFVIMVYRRPLSLTEDLLLSQIFGNNCITIWARIWSVAQLVIHSPRGQIKSLRTCFVLVFWMMVWSGIDIYR
jgi:hypothetical protein